MGSGSDPSTDGANLAGNEDVIVVAMNYRLGYLGFLPTDADGTGGMNGILDQVQALEWIQQRISFFGGDPDKVTVVLRCLANLLERGLYACYLSSLKQKDYFFGLSWKAVFAMLITTQKKRSSMMFSKQ